MTNLNIDKEFIIKLNSKENIVVYLSVSWQPGKGKDFGYKIIKRLDKDGVLTIGDTKGHENMDEARIRRIMLQADGFISVLPFRPDNSTKTSAFMLEELKIAIDLNLPIIILSDSRIPITTSIEGGRQCFTFQDGTRYEISTDFLTLYSAYDFGIEKSEEIQIIHFSDSILSLKSKKIQPYSFLICRLQPDFTLPRLACKYAAEAASGIPCLWIDSSDYQTNIDETTERARLLIKYAQFVIAEISLADENSTFDNPSRAHEIGLATGYQKKIFLVSHSPRRSIYHGLVSRQFLWWDNEEALYEDLKSMIYSERALFGRHIYNYELNQLDDGSKSNFPEPKFVPNAFTSWKPPIFEESEGTQSWIYAISFGVIVFCFSYLLSKIVGYDQTLDLIAIFAGIIAFFFSSRINKRIQKEIFRIGYLKWLIPLIAILFVLVFTFFKLTNLGNSDNKVTSNTTIVK